MHYCLTFVLLLLFLMSMITKISGFKGLGSAILGSSALKRKLLVARGLSSKFPTNDEPTIPDRPFTLPPGQFRPKQSLGQNYLSDQNYVQKIVDAFDEARRDVIGEVDQLGQRVIEIGPGIGALTRVLTGRYPQMTAVEIDQRAVAFLNDKLPKLKVIHQDILQFSYDSHIKSLNLPENSTVSIVANLPYGIVSQVLFALADTHTSIDVAVVTMQWEVGDRICARPNTKTYGIPSVIFQLYADCRIAFKIPPTVFYPVPKVDSALLRIDFTKPHKDLKTVYPEQLRKVVTASFRQRRKMLRQSLKELIITEDLVLSDHWATKRPESLNPKDFLTLTRELYAGRLPGDDTEESRRIAQEQKPNVWRGSLKL